MHDYYVNNNAQANGDHEVHKEGYKYMPSNKKYLGAFASCYGAVTQAKKTYVNSNGCMTCSAECHTG